MQRNRTAGDQRNHITLSVFRMSTFSTSIPTIRARPFLAAMMGSPTRRMNWIHTTRGGCDGCMSMTWIPAC